MQVPLTTLDFLERAETRVRRPRSPSSTSRTRRVAASARFTYAELGAPARALAVAFDELGLGAGERVAILSPNAARFLIALFGIPRATGASSSRSTSG